MIYLIIFGIDAIIVGGAMIAVNINVKREMKMKARIAILKSKRMQKKLEMWNEANGIIENLKIESE